MKKDLKFFTDLASSLGLPATNVQVTPFACTNDFSVASGNDSYFDIGNPAKGNIAVANIVAEGGGYFFYGNLWLKNYCTVWGAGGALTQWLAVGVKNNLGHYLTEYRSVIAADGTVNNSNEFVYQGCAFNYLRMANNTGGANFTYQSEILFRGVKITY